MTYYHNVQQTRNSGLTFKAKIRTILENNPAGLLWCGGYIYFGRKVLCLPF